MYNVCTIIVLTIQKIRLVLSIKRVFTKLHQNKILQILQIPQLRILQTVLKFVRLTVRQAVFNQNVMVLIALKLNALLAVNYLHVASQIVP